MRWLRSWPVPELPHRAHVHDELERLYTVDYDYTPLGAWFTANPDEAGVCLIEWDMALEPDEYSVFADAAYSEPDRVLVAPHILHHVEPDRPVWAHRVLRVDGSERWLQPAEVYCDYFAFGLIYFPRVVVEAFLAAEAPERGRPLKAPGGYDDCRFTDQTFSVWHCHRYQSKYASDRRRVRVEWRVHPVHLHGRQP